MITVTALVAGVNNPPSRLRVRQHIVPLGEHGIQVNEFVPFIDKFAETPSNLKVLVPQKLHGIIDCSWEVGLKSFARLPGIVDSRRANVTWLLGTLMQGRFSLESLLGRPLVFDVDDAIWVAKPSGRETVSRIAKMADVVLAGNPYIAEWFKDHANDVRVLPTGVDTYRWQPCSSELSHPKENFTIGWIGGASNFSYLYDIEDPLARFVQNHNAEVLIVAERPPSFKKIKPMNVRYIKWSPENEVQAVQQMDVGIMPLPSNEWAKGKCSFKMLEYMACGIPVIVSPIGMNSEVLSRGQLGIGARGESEWYEALEFFFLNPSLAKEWGRNGRMVAISHYSRIMVTEKLAQVFQELV